MGKSAKSRTAKAPAKTREQKQAETQTLALWALLGNGGAGFGSALKPEVERAEREGLNRAGLITVEKRGRSFWLEVSDHGWRWAEEHLADALPDKTYGGALVLHAWLRRLRAFMQARDVGLAEILSGQGEREAEEVHSERISETAAVSPPLDYSRLRERIRRAYLDITGGSFNKRALLKDIRAKLVDVDRDVLDEALEKMHFENGTMLMGLDNPREITAAVQDASLVFRGEPMHILWIAK
jgi:hypothetical protein